jgi:hypothetical protein
MLLFLEKDSTLKTPGEPGAEPPPEPEELSEKEKEKEKEKKKKRRLNVAAGLTDNHQELGQPLLITFSEKIKKLDSTVFQLTQDTTNIPVTFTTTFDSTRTKLSVVHEWKEGMPYRLIIPKESVEDSTGLQMTRADTINFKAKKESDYGKVFVTLQLSDSSKAVIPDSMHYVAQLIMNKEIKYSGTLFNGTWSQKRIQPGEYEIWILLDNNNNGKWDRGVYYGTPKKQPERVVSFPKKENLKANWLVRIPLTL